MRNKPSLKTLLNFHNKKTKYVTHSVFYYTFKKDKGYPISHLKLLLLGKNKKNSHLKVP